MANFSILPSPLIVGEDVSQDDFFNHMLSLPPSFEGRIALDTETTGLSITRDLPVFASMCNTMLVAIRHSSAWFIQPAWVTGKVNNVTGGAPSTISSNTAETLASPIHAPFIYCA